MKRRVSLALVMLALMTGNALPSDIRKGAIMQVKADSIWFEKAAGLTEWQKRRKTDTPAFFTSYEERLLSHRDAWQFIGAQAVRVLKVWPRHNRVSVEMRSPGRMSGTKWFVDASAIER